MTRPGSYRERANTRDSRDDILDRVERPSCHSNEFLGAGVLSAGVCGAATVWLPQEKRNL
jgi:hypothetical protein